MRKIISFSVLFFIFSFLMHSIVCPQVNIQTFFNHKFISYNTSSGLSDNNIYSFLIDSKGFLWIGTANGLNRYDGDNFRLFKKDPKINSIPDNSIYGLIEDGDSNIWIATGNGLSRYNPKKDSFINFKYNPDDSLSIPNNFVNSITIDSKNNIWISSKKNLSKVNYDEKQNKLNVKNYSNAKYAFQDKSISKIFADDHGKIHIGYYDQDFYRLDIFDVTSGQVNNFSFESDATSLGIFALSNDSYNNVWFGCWKLGLKVITADVGLQHFVNELNNKLPLQKIVDIIHTNDNKTWVTTRGDGLFIVDYKNRIVRVVKNNMNNPESICSNFLSRIIQDKFGTIWVGSLGKGISKIVPNALKISHIKNYTGIDNYLSDNEITGFVESKEGYIWIGTKNGGLNLYDPNTQRFRVINMSNGIGDNSVQAVCLSSQGYLWLSTENGEVNRLDLSKGNDPFVDRLEIKKYNLGKFSNSIYSIAEDMTGNIWFPIWSNGLFYYDKELDEIKRYFELNDINKLLNEVNIVNVFVDSKNNIWMGTFLHGLIKLSKRENNLYQHQSFTMETDSSLQTNIVHSITEDINGNLWVGTSEGLARIIFSSDTTKINSFEYVDKMKAVEIYHIKADSDNSIWMFTDKGLIRYDINNDSVIYFGESDGLGGTDYNASALMLSKTGKLFAGTSEGFYYFDTNEIEFNKNVPPIIFTGFKLYNDFIQVGQEVNERVLLENSITYANSVVLDYAENVFSIYFTAINFSSNGNTKYSYYLDGFDKVWTVPEAINYTTYTNLNPGEYTLKVKAVNEQGFSGEPSSLKIIVIPPFWQSNVFYIGSILFISIILYYIYKIRIKAIEKYNAKLENDVRERTIELEFQNDEILRQQRILEDQALELEQLNNQLEERVEERTKELFKAKTVAENADKLKSEFLAQMSHEIRTPVNVILCYISLYREDLAEKLSEDLRDSLDSLGGAGKRIIRTVDQILHMSELQTDNYEFKSTTVNLSALLKSIYNDFQPMAYSNNIKLIYTDYSENNLVRGDEHSIHDLFYNLIENAIKYTSKGVVDIIIKNYENNIFVSIKDTGIGIAEEFLPHLFEPFRQEEQGYTRRFEGNGLGLALVKKYCEINDAAIHVESIKGKGTTFTVEFKVI